MLPLRAHLCICMFLHRDGFWSSTYLLERQCLVYWSHSYTMAIFLKQTVYNAGKCPFTRWEKWKEFSMYASKFIPKSLISANKIQMFERAP